MYSNIYIYLNMFSKCFLNEDWDERGQLSLLLSNSVNTDRSTSIITLTLTRPQRSPASLRFSGIRCIATFLQIVTDDTSNAIQRWSWSFSLLYRRLLL